MDKLTNKEEEIMHVLWKLKQAFVKEVVAELPDPKPHYNTFYVNGYFNQRNGNNDDQSYQKVASNRLKKSFVSEQYKIEQKKQHHNTTCF